MSAYPFLTMYTSGNNVSSADYLDIDFSAAGFSSPPIINASIDSDINVYVSDVTSSTARLNFSATFTGRVTYIIRPATT